MAVEELINELANHGQFNPASSQHLAYEECGEHCWDEDCDSDCELDEPKNDEPKKEAKPVTLDNLSENINLRLSTLWVQRVELAVGFGLRDSGSLQGARVRPSSKVTRSVQCPESLRLLLCAHPYSETPAAMCGRCFRNNCWLTLRFPSVAKHRSLVQIETRRFFRRWETESYPQAIPKRRHPQAAGARAPTRLLA